MTTSGKLVQNLFTYRLPVIKLVVKEMDSAKLYGILLVLVALVGFFSLCPAISTLINDVIIRSTGEISARVTVYAASGSAEDIQEAVDEAFAAGGGDVYIPAGDFNFGVGTVSIPAGVNIYGDADPPASGVKGAGTIRTILRIPLGDESPRNLLMFSVHGEPWTGETEQRTIEISGIAFIGHGGWDENNGRGDVAISIDNTKDFRVHNCHFEKMGSVGVNIQNSEVGNLACQGVIDHCNFIDMQNLKAENIGVGWGYGVEVFKWWGSTPWDEDIDAYLGKYADTTFIESCYFEDCRHCVASSAGAHYVFRHNKVMYPSYQPQYSYFQVDAHGTFEAKNDGTRCIEVYDNVFYNPTPIWESGAIQIRGGGGVIFNNIVGVDHDYLTGIWFWNDEGNPANPKCLVHDFWIWNNTMNVEEEISAESDIVLGEDYFLYAKPSYVPYPYPHPLTSG
jgi:hypothetical protein